MDKITFTDATLKTQGYVTIDGTNYDIVDTTYTGGTDLNASTFNTMQANIENTINNNSKYLIVTPDTNGDYKGDYGISTIATNQIFHIYFNGNATTGTSAARISLDNGTTYFNTDTIAKEVENKKMSFVYNGTSFNFIGRIKFTSNNHNYIKYDDDTLVCYGNVLFTNLTNANQVGALYYTSQLSLGNYLTPFTATPVLEITANGTLSLAEMNSFSSTSLGNVFLYNGTSRSGTTETISYYAIGKWR